MLSFLRVSLAAAVLVAASGCPDDDPPEPPIPDDAINATNFAVSEPVVGCFNASPKLIVSRGEPQILVVSLPGEVRALDPETLEVVWGIDLEAPPGEMPAVLATPAIVGSKAIFAWQDTATGPGDPIASGARTGHYVTAIDLEARALDTEMTQFQLSSTLPAFDGSGTVTMNSRFQLLRSAIHTIDVPGTELGYAYISLGNGPSIQPFHGWVFEIDLDAWAAGGTPIRSSFVTTAENDCLNDTGPQLATMLCGGGVWTAAGLLVTEDAAGQTELIVPTGNGRVNYDIRAFAHSLLRMRPGLDFDPTCDATACADFDEIDPALSCLESCEDIFTPRLTPGQTFQPEDGICDGLNFIECYGILDADFGASAPVEVQVPDGPRVFVQPAKDGALYLIDAEHMGTLYERYVATPFCGTADTPCGPRWTGVYVTQPVVGTVDGDPVVVAVSHMFDRTHWAGLLALRIVMEDGAPRFVEHWTMPDREGPEKATRFRVHAGRPVLHTFEGEDYVWVVEAKRQPHTTPPAHLWGVRLRDGALMQRSTLAGEGIRYNQPLIVGDDMYVASCDGNMLANGTIHAYRITRGSGMTDMDGGVPMDTGTIETCEPAGGVCDGTQFCNRNLGMCESPGLCMPRPSTCDPSDAPVCGCDTTTYANECEAHAAGVSILAAGPCP